MFQRKITRILSIYFYCFFIYINIYYTYAISRPPSINTEFRGAWVVNVFNLDWPSKKGLSAQAQKNELLQIINTAKSLNLNALIFQIRSACDAVYNSKYEPWSPFLSGSMGQNPGYDPLQFVITHAHRQGLEVHAWLNPFRALASNKIAPSRNHISRTNPESIVKFENKIWLNPASKIAQQRFLNVVNDIINRYDIDGIHIDDYFYPYPNNVNHWHIDKFNDHKHFAHYKNSGGKIPKLIWRQENINKLIYQLNKLILKKKSVIRLGISPFGIWQSNNPVGVIAQLNSLKHINADSKKWLNHGLMNYFSPQLYWRDHPRKQSFSALLTWWNLQNRKKIHIWPGIATDRINSSADPGRPAREIINQILITRKLRNNGHIHFRIGSIMKNKDGIANKLKSTVYQYPALTPQRKYMIKSNKLSRPKVYYDKIKKFNSSTSLDLQLKIMRSKNAWLYAIQTYRRRTKWKTERIISSKNITLRSPNQILNFINPPDNRILAFAVTAINRWGIKSKKTIVKIR